LVLPHLDDAYTLARWLIGSGAESEDVVQEACLRAFRSIGSFGNGNARARILTIVRQSAYAWLNRNRAPAPVNVEDPEPVENAKSVSESSGVQDRVAISIAQTDVACLKAAIAALASPFREVVVLRDIQGLPYREIADVIEAPIGTVMSRLARGRGLVLAAIGCSA
jgi:RNA polymerase sigma-70 factor (ECF subfamily)